MKENLIPTKIDSLLSKIITMISQIVGKGYGSSSVEREVKMNKRLLVVEGGGIFVDIGANKGKYTSELIKNYKNAEIHIFEPNKLNYNLLTKSFSGLAKVKINNKAVSNDAGTQKLHSNVDGSGLASLYDRKLNRFGIEMNFKEDVDVISFDSYYTENLDGKIVDLVKLDIEGNELNALKGMINSIKKIRQIQFEFGGCNIDSRTFFQDFWYFFKERGFQIYRISPIGLIKLDKYKESDEFFSITNYIARNPDL